MNCVRDVQSGKLWSLTPTSLLNGLQLIGLIPLYTSMCKIPWGICDLRAVSELYSTLISQIEENFEKIISATVMMSSRLYY